jgi:hypothetical protein
VVLPRALLAPPGHTLLPRVALLPMSVSLASQERIPPRQALLSALFAALGHTLGRMVQQPVRPAPRDFTLVQLVGAFVLFVPLDFLQDFNEIAAWIPVHYQKQFL